MLRSADRYFIVVREEALCLMCAEEANVVEMRSVEKAASCLSVPVGGSVSCVLGMDAVVLGDGGVSSGAVGMYMYVFAGDVSVSGGGDTELCGFDTVLSSAVSGGLCVLYRMSGCGDTDVSGDDTVVSGAISGGLCDLDRVSGGDVVVRVGEISLAGSGDTVACGVDEPMCGDSSVMTAGEFDVRGCDSIVSDGAGDSSGVGVVDDVVACGDDTLLHDAVRVAGWLSVVGDTLMCGAGVARSNRRDPAAVVGLVVAQPVGWMGSSAQTIPCTPSHHRCTQCVCVVVYWQLPDI